MNLTVKQLKVFIAVFESRSFTVAAQSLHMTQSAVSKMCKDLESEVGFLLFERSTRSVIPVDGAADLYAFAREVLSTLDAAERSLSGLKSLQRGNVHAAASPMMMYGLLAGAIQQFHADYPSVKFELFELSTDETIDYVVSGKADFGLVSIDAQHEKLISEPVYKDKMYAVCNDLHPLAKSSATSWKALAQYQHIGLRSVYSVRRTIDEIVRLNNLVFPSVIETGTLISTLGLVRAGLGIAIIPGYICGLAKQLELVVLPITGVKVFHELSLIRRKNSRPSMAAASFIDVLRKSLVRSSGTARR
jgi:DNA-binding transcriptional LysR family regulator